MIHLKIDIEVIWNWRKAVSLFSLCLFIDYVLLIMIMFIYCIYYKCHKTNPNRDESYVYSRELIQKKKKETINSINKADDKCVQYAVTVAINHWKIGKNSERITKNFL